MSIHNLPFQLWEARQKIVKSATVALRADEVDHSSIKGDTAAGAVALTLPAGAHDYDGFEVEFINSGANTLTIICAAGFGGGGAGKANIVLAQGELARVRCRDANWYSEHHTAPA